MDNIEVGKYYVLDPKRYYFCTNIQLSIKIQVLELIVKVEHTTCLGDCLFGKLVKHSSFGDEVTETELEFCSNDIIKEHNYKEYCVPLFWMDFVFNNKVEDETL